MTNDFESQPVAIEVDVRHLTEIQFAQLGLPHIAYVKAIDVNGARAFAIHGADGTPMGVAPGLDIAFAAVGQHEMLAVRVH